MSLSHKKPLMDPELVADVNKLKMEVKDLKTNKDISMVLDDMRQQLELTQSHGDELRNMIENMVAGDIDEKVYTTMKRVEQLDQMFNDLPIIPTQKELDDLKSETLILRQQQEAT